VIAFGDRVREARQRIRTPAGGRLTQSDLAVAVGVERNTVSRWENSGVCPKDPQVIRKLAAVLKVSADWLLADDDGGQPWASGGPESGGVVTRGNGGGRAGRVGVMGAAGAAGEVLAYRMPPAAYERVHGYIERVEQAGATPEQAEEVARILVEAAATRLRGAVPRDRPVAAVIADIDAAWRYASTILRAEGVGVDVADRPADVAQPVVDG
jgi:DNA-binding XRE family transcriptional regulator